MDLNFPLIYWCFLFVGLAIFLYIFNSKKFTTQKSLEKIISLEQVSKKNNTSLTYELTFQLGLLQLKKKEYNKAIEQFRNCLLLWDKNDILALAVLYNTIGFCYYKSDKLEISIYYYNQSISLLPDYISALNNLGIVFERQFDKQKSLYIYKQILKYDPTNLNAKERCLILNNAQ